MNKASLGVLQLLLEKKQRAAQGDEVSRCGLNRPQGASTPCHLTSRLPPVTQEGRSALHFAAMYNAPVVMVGELLKRYSTAAKKTDKVSRYDMAQSGRGARMTYPLLSAANHRAAWKAAAPLGYHKQRVG